MKIKFKINRRHNIYFTLFACGTGLWLMVTRFGLSIDKLLSYALISAVFLAVIVGIAAVLGFLIRVVRDKND